MRTRAQAGCRSYAILALIAAYALVTLRLLAVEEKELLQHSRLRSAFRAMLCLPRGAFDNLGKEDRKRKEEAVRKAEASRKARGGK